MNIYVGNLSYSIDESKLKELFEEFGTVVSAKIITDKFTGSSKGFAFVEMGSEEEGQEAIDNLNGKSIDGRNLRVNKAHPQERRQPNGGGSRDGGGSRGPRRY